MDAGRQSFRRWWVGVLAATDISYGGAYLLGVTSSSPALAVMEQLIPLRGWGAVLAGAGVLLLIGQYAAAGVLGALMYGFLVWASGLTLASGSGGAGAFLTGGITALHLLISYGALRGYADQDRR